jgi:hypothetical protein
MSLLSYFGKQNGSLTGTPPHRSLKGLAERCAVNDDGKRGGTGNRYATEIVCANKLLMMNYLLYIMI